MGRCRTTGEGAGRRDAGIGRLSAVGDGDRTDALRSTSRWSARLRTFGGRAPSLARDWPARVTEGGCLVAVRAAGSRTGVRSPTRPWSPRTRGFTRDSWRNRALPSGDRRDVAVAWRGASASTDNGPSRRLKTRVRALPRGSCDPGKPLRVTTGCRGVTGSLDTALPVERRRSKALLRAFRLVDGRSRSVALGTCSFACTTLIEAPVELVVAGLRRSRRRNGFDRGLALGRFAE